ncbi:hypothetical protein GCK72_007049 [Caenorhabditis remanei]|uniref:Uncharacterized protein n=1 Tax=Caenorhabditis remanei TaxID=31234 RepID=A0A6A5HIX5_CAERE|nr:hypothetical protein GCK72_007049 [Caenorhabditis remanei]KAF1767091.1 hypothetical protein GCK72_007049 [Caenorhabditis remanei]
MNSTPPFPSWEDYLKMLSGSGLGGRANSSNSVPSLVSLAAPLPSCLVPRRPVLTLTRTASSLPATTTTVTVQTPTTPDPPLAILQKQVFCSYEVRRPHARIPESCYGSFSEDVSEASMESPVPPLIPLSSSSLVSEHLTSSSLTLSNSSILSSPQISFQESQIGLTMTAPMHSRDEPRIRSQSASQPDTTTECSRTTPFTSAVMLNRLIVSNTQTTEKESSSLQSPVGSQISSSAATSPSPSLAADSTASPHHMLATTMPSEASPGASPAVNTGATGIKRFSSPPPNQLPVKVARSSSPSRTSSVPQTSPPTTNALSSPHPAPSTSNINVLSAGSISHSRLLQTLQTFQTLDSRPDQTAQAIATGHMVLPVVTQAFPLDPSMNWSGSGIPDTIPLIEPTPDYKCLRELRTYRTKRMRAAGKIQIPAPLLPGTPEYYRLYLAAMKNAGESAVYKDPKMTLRSSIFDPNSAATLPQQVKYPMGSFVCYRSWRRSQNVKLDEIKKEWEVIKRENGAEKKEWVVRASNLLNEHYAQLRAGYIVLKSVDGKKKKVERRFKRNEADKEESDEEDKEEDDDLDS